MGGSDLNYLNVYLDGVYIIITYILVVKAIETTPPLLASVLLKEFKPVVYTATAIPFFLFWELRGISPNFHIHVSVSDLYIPRIGPHISSSRNMGIYNSLTDT